MKLINNQKNEGTGKRNNALWMSMLNTIIIEVNIVLNPMIQATLLVFCQKLKEDSLISYNLAADLGV